MEALGRLEPIQPGGASDDCLAGLLNDAGLKSAPGHPTHRALEVTSLIHWSVAEGARPTRDWSRRHRASREFELRPCREVEASFWCHALRSSIQGSHLRPPPACYFLSHALAG